MRSLLAALVAGLLLSLAVIGGAALLATSADEKSAPRYEAVAGWPALPPGVTLGGVTAVAVDAQDRVYLFHRGKPPILVFEAADENGEPRLLDRANLPGSPYGIAIDNENGMLWVTQTDRNRVVGFELTDLAPKRVVSYPTVQQPNTVAVNPANEVVYVAGRANGELQAIDTRRDPGDG